MKRHLAFLTLLSSLLSPACASDPQASASGDLPSPTPPPPLPPASTSEVSSPSAAAAPPAPDTTPLPPVDDESEKHCQTDADCRSGACDERGFCAVAPSCVHAHGGLSCGEGESDGPHTHESCCKTLPMRVDGRVVMLDKYNITAGRMRTFIEAVNGNVRGWIEQHRPPIWDPRYEAFLPADFDGDYNVYDNLGPAALYEQISVGTQTYGCNLKGYGARTYWVPDNVNEFYGDIPQTIPKDILDEKTLNCTSAIMFAAFCAWDGGGRLPTPEEMDWAWNGGPDDQRYPWGDGPEPYNAKYQPNGVRGLANYALDYAYPAPPEGTDLTAHVAPPGRFPKGVGKYGHQDLVGNMFAITWKLYTNGPYTPDPLGQWTEWGRGGSWEDGQPVPFEDFSLVGEPGHYHRHRAPLLRKYWGGGVRCARDAMPGAH